MTYAAVDRLILDRDVTAAVELVRDLMGCNLETAVEIVEQRQAALHGWAPPLPPEPRAPEQPDVRSGFASVDEVKVARPDEFDADAPAFSQRDRQPYTDEV
jgi:hypothetical protein